MIKARINQLKELMDCNHKKYQVKTNLKKPIKIFILE